MRLCAEHSCLQASLGCDTAGNACFCFIWWIGAVLHLLLLCYVDPPWGRPDFETNVCHSTEALIKSQPCTNAYQLPQNYYREGETFVTMLRYATTKNIALPQATALSLGSSHTSVILSSPGNDQNRLLATFGNGEFFRKNLSKIHDLGLHTSQVQLGFQEF